MDTPKLTAYSHGSGCGCKIAPQTLEQIIQHLPASTHTGRLLVGRNTKDDAAVYDLGGDQALIATVDCFTPIVDDARDFGMIAAANAISDVYAMGGKPIFALAILGWPIDKLSAEHAGTVLSGGQAICDQIGIPLAGGHSIDSPEPLFGLAVNGLVDKKQLVTNAGSKEGDVLFLTKPIGTGIIAAAQKRDKASDADIAYVTQLMKEPNTVGMEIARLPGIHAMTDVTGFGLLGHLIEMCEGAQLSCEINFEQVPQIPAETLAPYSSAYIMPDNTYRNFNSYKDRTSELSAEQLMLLCDPQTNGGLLFAVAEEHAADVSTWLKAKSLPYRSLGQFTAPQQKTVKVR